MESFKNILSLKEASSISGYNSDYLSYLIRTGKLKGHRVGRNWFTTKEDIELYLSKTHFAPVKNLLFSAVTPTTLLIMAIIIFVGTAILIFIAAQTFNPVAPETVITRPAQTLPTDIDAELNYRQ